MSLTDYEVLCPLNYNSKSAINSYNATKKSTNEHFILHTIKLDDLKIENPINKIRLLKLAADRKDTKHPNLLELRHFFVEKPSKVFYLISESCTNGNLTNLIDKCIKETKQLSEELICKILYQILCVIKTTTLFSSKLNANHIFLDDDFNVKLLNFDPTKSSSKSKHIKASNLNRILYNLTTLKEYEKSTFQSDFEKLQMIYSEEFLTLMSSVVAKGQDVVLHKNLDKILCNSTLILKSSQWVRNRSFFTPSFEVNSLKSDKSDKKSVYWQKFKELHERELLVRVKEENLKQKEKKLWEFEKRLIEREMKLNKVECGEKNENLSDGSVSADCEDSVKITCKQMDYFRRSKSERRVKFKGNSPAKKPTFSPLKKANCSPLKRVNYNNLRRRTVRYSRSNDKENIQEESNTLKAISEKSGCSSEGAPKTLFSSKEFEEDKGCRPISWNIDSKKQAFDLLRIMNSANNIVMNKNCGNEVKHTFL